jgi:hypothetical protein
MPGKQADQPVRVRGRPGIMTAVLVPAACENPGGTAHEMLVRRGLGRTTGAPRSLRTYNIAQTPHNLLTAMAEPRKARSPRSGDAPKFQNKIHRFDI